MHGRQKFEISTKLDRALRMAGPDIKAIRKERLEILSDIAEKGDIFFFSRNVLHQSTASDTHVISSLVGDTAIAGS